MKKSWLVIVGAMALLMTIAAIAIFAGKQTDHKKSDTPAHGEHAAQGHLGKKDACDYLSQKDAETLLGSGAEKGSLNADTSSDDVHVSTCSYNSKAETLPEVRNIRTASLLVRAPLTEAGGESNEVPFEKQPDGAQKVEGYGQQAYWDGAAGQLHILVDDVWMIMTHGKSNDSDRSLEDAKKLADVVLAAYSAH